MPVPLQRPRCAKSWGNHPVLGLYVGGWHLGIKSNTMTTLSPGGSRSPSSRKARGRPARIRTPTQADVNDAAVAKAVIDARSRSPTKRDRGSPNLAKSATKTAGTGEPAPRLRTMMSADLSHHQMYGVRAIQQDLSKARNKSQQIAVLVQYQDALSEILLSAADAIAPNQLEKDLRREPIKVVDKLVTKVSVNVTIQCLNQSCNFPLISLTHVIVAL